MNAYTSLEAQLHDAFWADEETPELLWMESLLEEPALEIGCGSGRLLLPLLQKSLAVEGLDNSPDMLALCRESALKLGVNPVLHEGDMATFFPGKAYGSLLVPAFTFQLSDDPAATLANFRRLLRPGGLLYLTVFIPLAEIHRELPENEWYSDHQTTLPDGRHASVETRFRLDRKTRQLHREHRYRLAGPDGEKEHLSRQTVRWFTPRQLQRLLTDAGFAVENAVADFDEEIAVDEDSQIITIVARSTFPQS
ncbi:class I SAM-dependent methyltransferase [Haloferula sargassicola]|uniref:Methyltransferase domain-containing protein n=1 Tax=Haloferula sargassicola TaxID=490096 RepID=A0ABP9UQV9_9BACT